ncbi:MAG TPA: ABC transporter substrate-binding protein [Pyrinomonadaceae bacterium]
MKRSNSSKSAPFVAPLLSLLAAAAALLAGCGAAGPAAPAAKSDATPQRIISFSPSSTEVLYGIGAFDRVVAVSQYDEFPPEVARLPRVGGWSNTNMEQVASLRPDLIIITEAHVPFVKDKLETMGVRTVVVGGVSFADVYDGMEKIGAATGREAEARRLIEETRARLEEVRARTRGLPRPRVLCIADRLPGTLRGLYAATGGSFIVELIEAAGGESIAPPAEKGFGQISKEAVVELDPEVIIDMAQSSNDAKLAEDPREVWGELSQVRAVREGRVYSLRDTSLIHPSQFVADSARKFAELLHPEAFGKK